MLKCHLKMHIFSMTGSQTMHVKMKWKRIWVKSTQWSVNYLNSIKQFIDASLFWNEWICLWIYIEECVKFTLWTLNFSYCTERKFICKRKYMFRNDKLPMIQWYIHIIYLFILVLVFWIVGNLRNMAIDMGSELDNQNRMIDRINAKVSHFDLNSLPLKMRLIYGFCVTLTGWIKRNKDSSGKRASSSAPQINCLYHPYTPMQTKKNKREIKTTTKLQQQRTFNKIPTLCQFFTEKRKEEEEESQYLYKLCIKID